MKLSELKCRSKCDGCGAEFDTSEIELMEMPKNIVLYPFHNTIRFVDKKGVIRGGQPNPEKGDRVGGCPKCKQVHLFGFDLVDKKGRE